MNDTPRLCIDCRYAQSDDPANRYRWRCAHPTSALPPEIDLVTGEPTPPTARTCQEARAYPSLCSKAGRYWEARS